MEGKKGEILPTTEGVCPFQGFSVKEAARAHPLAHQRSFKAHKEAATSLAAATESVSDTRGRTAVVGFLLAAQLLYQARDRAESSCCPKRKHRAWAFNRLTSAHSFHSPSYLSPSFSKHKLLVHVKIMTLHW